MSWPLSTLLNELLGWRGACVVWAIINLAIALPLNRFLLPSVRPSPVPLKAATATVGWRPYREMFLLAFSSRRSGS